MGAGERVVGHGGDAGKLMQYMENKHARGWRACTGEELRKELIPLVEGLGQGLSGKLWGLVLFGSVARGEAQAGSDLDLLLVDDSSPEKLTARMRYLCCLLPGDLRGAVSDNPRIVSLPLSTLLLMR